MPSQTAGGLPYPLPTEPVRDGAQAIHNLADAIQARGGGQLIQAGNSSGVTQPTGVLRVNFPVAFKSGTSPVVVAWGGDFEDANWNYILSFAFKSYGWDNQGFHVVAHKEKDGTPYGSQTLNLQWIAMGQAA